MNRIEEMRIAAAATAAATAANAAPAPASDASIFPSVACAWDKTMQQTG